MARSKIHFLPVSKDKQTVQPDEVGRLFHEAGLQTCISPGDLTAVKAHFGEEGNKTHIAPNFIRPVVQAIEKAGGKPFLTDTCVLYKSERDDAVKHLNLAHRHGFTLDAVGAPVVIADGLIGGGEKEVEIPGIIFKKVSISTAAIDANAIIAVSHATGHLGTGLGSAIKNLGMGLASRKGKLRQHSASKPRIATKACTGCGLCVRWCPANAISVTNGKALINNSVCIGCGECITVCRFDAVRHDWNSGSENLQKRMAEHALGALSGKSGKAGFITSVCDITKDCDCWSESQTPVLPDIGWLAGTDPVAMDMATLDLIQSRTGQTLREKSYPEIDPMIQLRHGVEIGLGSMDYELIELG